MTTSAPVAAYWSDRVAVLRGALPLSREGASTRAPRAHRPPRTRSSDHRPTARDLHRAGCQPSVRLRNARRPAGAVLAREQVGVPLPMACSTTWRSSDVRESATGYRVNYQDEAGEDEPEDYGILEIREILIPIPSEPRDEP